MKIVHISPTYFDDSSVIGGGERYPTELAASMAKGTDTTLVSFSSERQSYFQGDLKIEVYPVKYLLQNNNTNPFSVRYLTSILRADIVHIHGLYGFPSVLAAFGSILLGKPIFGTDYGGGSGLGWMLNQKLHLLQRYQKFIAYSQFGLNFLPPDVQNKAILLKGGIDTDRFCPDPTLKKENTILYVGRIMPHKGINYLVEAFRLLNRPDYKLKIIGRIYSDQFYQDLKELAEGFRVEFIHDADDNRLLQEYRQAKITVLPSVHTHCYGGYTPVPELMGFTLLESQACGTPVICTDAGAMHEFVDPGQTGFVVQQNSGDAIATALQEILNLSQSEYEQYQSRCRKWIQPLSWSTVVEKHLSLYRGQDVVS